MGFSIASIQEAHNNIPQTALDYENLELIFTGDLGTTEDYQREYQDTPFGLLVSKIAKLEYEAAIAAFSEFINDQSLSQVQIVFVKKVVDYIVQNGYIDNVSELTKQRRLVEMVTKIKENAVKIIG